MLTQLATWCFTPVICMSHFKTWPRRFAWFTLNHWIFAIPRYGWCISTYKPSMLLPMFHHQTIWLIIIMRMHLPLSFYGYKLHKGCLCRCSAIGQWPQANSYKRDLQLTSCPFYCCFFCFLVVFSLFMYPCLLFLVVVGSQSYCFLMTTKTILLREIWPRRFLQFAIDHWKFAITNHLDCLLDCA